MTVKYPDLQLCSYTLMYLKSEFLPTGPYHVITVKSHNIFEHEKHAQMS